MSNPGNYVVIKILITYMCNETIAQKFQSSEFHLGVHHRVYRLGIIMELLTRAGRVEVLPRTENVSRTPPNAFPTQP